MRRARPGESMTFRAHCDATMTGVLGAGSGVGAAGSLAAAGYRPPRLDVEMMTGALLLHMVEKAEDQLPRLLLLGPPDPLVGLAAAGHVITAAHLPLLAARFRARWGLPDAPHIVVHDACHELLAAPATPEGEVLVLTFQRQHLVYDPDPDGAAIFYAAATSLVRAAAGSSPVAAPVGPRPALGAAFGPIPLPQGGADA